MTTETLEAPAATAPVAAAPAAPAVPPHVASAARRAAEDAANESSRRKQYLAGYIALIFAAVVSLGAFGVIAWNDSVSANPPAETAVSVSE